MSLLPQSAGAHDDRVQNDFVVWNSSSPSFCVEAHAAQGHDYTNVLTSTSLYECNYGLKRDPGYIRHYFEYYVDGTGPCHYAGDYRNHDRTYLLTTLYWKDVWHLGCGKAPGQHVWITMDQWSRAAYHHSWYPNYYGWPGVRPITWHCHCP